MNPERSHLLGQAFRDVPLQFAGFTLRPFSAGSLMDLQDLKNPLFTFRESEEEPAAEDPRDPLAALYPLIEFIWLHTADEELVGRLLASGKLDEVRALVRQFSRTIMVADLHAFQESFEQLNAQTTAAMVEAIDEEGGGTGKPESSLTGSLPSSSTSGAPETLPGSITSFDDCLLPGPSSTSTPPGFTTAGSAGGPAPLIIPLIPVPTPSGSSS